MFKNRQNFHFEIEQARIKLENVLASTENNFNKAHGLLFTDNNLSVDTLLELDQIMDVSGAIASSRLDIYSDKFKQYINHRKKRMYFVMALYLLIMLTFSFFPPILLLNIIIILIINNPKEKEYLINNVNKLERFSSKMHEFSERYINYNKVIFSRIAKKEDDENIEEDTIDMLLTGIDTSLMLKAIDYINNLLDENITEKEIPEELIPTITLILARDLDTKPNNLTDLLTLAKTKFNKNIQERALHI